MFGELSGDMNPAHFDEAYAATTPFKTRIAHGDAFGELHLHHARHADAGAGHDLHEPDHHFKAPVKIGDHVTATCTVREVILEKSAA